MKETTQMKKCQSSLTVAVLCLAMLLASCSSTLPGGDNTTSSSIPGTTPPDTTTPSPETTTPAPDTTTSASVTTPDTTTDAPTTDPTAPRSIRILAIGNSFSTDCMQYLYDIMKSGGVEQIILGNLYYGGGSLAQHLDFAKNNKAVYTYYKNTAGN